MVNQTELNCIFIFLYLLNIDLDVRVLPTEKVIGKKKWQTFTDKNKLKVCINIEH